MIYLTTHSTHFILQLYGVHMVKDHSDSERGNLLPPHGLLFSINCKGFICTIPHTTAFVTPVVEHCLEREIAQWVHPIKDRSDNPSHHEQTLLPRSYISLHFIPILLRVHIYIHTYISVLHHEDHHSLLAADPRIHEDICRFVFNLFGRSSDRSFSVDPAAVWAIFRSNQWPTTGLSKAVVCTVLSMEKCI